MRAVLLALWIASCCTPAFAGENRLGFGRIALDGNVRSVRLDFGPLGTTTLQGQAEGRTFADMTFRIPIPASGKTGALLVPTVTSEGGGEARYLGWDSAPAPLAVALKQRSLPPVLRGLPRPTVLSLLLIVLSAFGAWLARRAERPLTALAIGMAGAAALLGWSHAFLRVDSSVARVVDFAGLGPGASGLAWAGVETTGRYEQINLGGSTLSLEVLPEGSPLSLVLSMDQLGPTGEDWQAGGPRASRLWVRRPWSGNEGRWLETSGDVTQDLGDFQASWARSSASEVTALGPWSAGEACPEPVFEAQGPPSWLLSGLPTGREALIGQLASGGTWVRAAWPPTKGASGARTWPRPR